MSGENSASPQTACQPAAVRCERRRTQFTVSGHRVLVSQETVMNLTFQLPHAKKLGKLPPGGSGPGPLVIGRFPVGDYTS